MSSSPTATGGRKARCTEQELLRVLEANLDSTIAVTSTERAARELRYLYSQQQQASGRSGWRPPQILAWRTWLESLWQAAILHGGEKRLLLTEIQELEIWHAILRDDPVAGEKFSLTSLARLAQQVWGQMQSYSVGLDSLRHELALDTVSFLRWARKFESLCRQSSFLAPALLEEAAEAWAAASILPLPSELLLIGFDRKTPLQTAFIEKLSQQGCSVSFLQLAAPNGERSSASVIYTQTLEEEIYATAAWIREKLLQNPAQRIACIVPAIENMRGLIDSIFRRVLAPSSMLGNSGALLPYEFSLGTPMHRLRAIRTALLLLQWLAHPLSSEEVSWMLVHGDLGHNLDASRDLQAKIDRDFRERKSLLGGPVSLAAFLRWIRQPSNPYASSELRHLLENFSRAGRPYLSGKSRTLLEWRSAVEELLAAAGWGLVHPSSSAEFQLQRRWAVLLDQFSSISRFAGVAPYFVAVDKLTQLAATMLFSLETHHAPVQIVGVTESAGLVFDAVWWMNVRNDAWPPSGKALPFLPWSVQRQAHMPFADLEADKAFASSTVGRVLNSAKEVVFSFSLNPPEAAEISTHTVHLESVLSPIVRDALPPNTPWFAATPLQDSISNLDALEAVHNEAPPVFHSTSIHSGIRFLELQAACPFRAFAELRLHARPLKELPAGMTGNDQGSVVHRVLDAFWSNLRTRAALLATSPEQLRSQLQKYIQTALEPFEKSVQEPWQQNLLRIEAERIEKRLLEWLEEEKQRPDFTVAATETALEAKLGGIQFQCRIDRVDQVEQGVVLLDYKTGAIQRSACVGERPDQPQLPAYAVLRRQAAATEPLAGFAFGSLHPQNLGFTVIGAQPGVFPEETSATTFTPEQMEVLEEEWRTLLTRLAEDFREGVATVDPKQEKVTCTYCSLDLLCRVRETSPTTKDDAPETSFTRDPDE